MLVGGGAVLVWRKGQLIEGAPHMQSQQQAVGLLLIDPSEVSRVRGVMFRELLKEQSTEAGRR